MTRFDHGTRTAPLRLALAFSAVAFVGGCAAATPSSPNTVPTAPPSVAASRGPAPSATSTTDALSGTWATGAVSCDQEAAALTHAAFTQQQLASGGWDGTCTGPLAPFTVRFAAGRLLIFENGETTWDGRYDITADDMFAAGDNGTMYLTYRFEISDDELTVDMIADEVPGAGRLGDSIAQTVIFESAPFARQ